MLRLLLLFVLMTSVASAQWISAYYAGWMQGNQWSYHLPADKVDYSAVTHIMHFSVDPTRTGGVVFSDITNWSVNQAVMHAHNAEKKILISVGGWGSDNLFRGATRAEYLDIFVSNLVAFIELHDYDGIDLDWEPIEAPAKFNNLVVALRKAMPSDKLLTCAVMTEDLAVAAVHEHFDQINIMTYDLSGPWPGWVTWHNAPIYNGGNTFYSTGRLLPSADMYVDQLISAGVPKEKIGIGLDWYGYAWHGGSGTPTGGVTAPYQQYTTDPIRDQQIGYYQIKDRWSNVPETWDVDAQAAYLSIDAASNTDDYFISFDNEQTGQAKIDYVREKGIGGLIVWELGGGYRPGEVQPDMLLQALKASYGGDIPSDTTEPPIPEPEPCDTVFVEQSDSVAYWLGFRDGQALADTILVSIPVDTVYLPSPPDTILVPSGHDTLYVIPKRFEVIIKE